VTWTAEFAPLDTPDGFESAAAAAGLTRGSTYYMMVATFDVAEPARVTVSNAVEIVGAYRAWGVRKFVYDW
jgi:hypothetical protein